MVSLSLCIVVWSQESVGPVIRIKHDPNSYEGGLSHQMHQRVTNRMWKSRIAAISETPNQEQSKLNDLINQLNAVRIKRVVLPVSPEPAPSQSQVSKGSAVSVAISDTNAVASKKVEIPLEAQGPLTSRTLAQITRVQEAKGQVEHPLELAEVLFANGYPQQARTFYEQTLTEAGPNRPLDKAWVLLQLGNCHKHDNLLEAGRYYREVLDSHADSPWAGVARVQLALVQWTIKNRPQELLQESRGLPAKPPVATAVQ